MARTPDEIETDRFMRGLPGWADGREGEVFPSAVTIAELPAASGGFWRAIQDSATNRYQLVRDATNPVTGEAIRRWITPPITAAQIVGVATLAIEGNQRILTWPHTARILALGMAVGLKAALPPE